MLRSHRFRFEKESTTIEYSFIASCNFWNKYYVANQNIICTHKLWAISNKKTITITCVQFQFSNRWNRVVLLNELSILRIVSLLSLFGMLTHLLLATKLYFTWNVTDFLWLKIVFLSYFLFFYSLCCMQRIEYAVLSEFLA